MTYAFKLTPVGKPRMTQRDKWRPAAKRYYAYANHLQLLARQDKYTLTVPLSANFYLPMPKSWSKKKREEMNGKPHTQKPDLSNLLKAFEDALLNDDSGVWRYEDCGKYWSDRGLIVVSV